MASKFVVAALLLIALGSASAIMCPTSSKFNGCMPEGCMGIPTSRRTMDVVCDACGEGYILAYRGTKEAKCECAPGWAGKGNNGVCMKCPAGTQIAIGGPIAYSQCLSCPEGTLWSLEAQDCMCPSGTKYEKDNSKTTGYKHVACKPCAGKLEYMDLNMHARTQCKLCPAGLVPNTERTECVPANHPAAVSVSRQSVFGRIAALVAPKAAESADPDRAPAGAAPRPDNSITAVLSDLVHIWAKNSTATAVPKAARHADAPNADAPKPDVQAAVQAEAPKAAVQAVAPEADAAHKVDAPKADAPKVDAPKGEAPKSL